MGIAACMDGRELGAQGSLLAANACASPVVNADIEVFCSLR
jgi:hypothetical protein